MGIKKLIKKIFNKIGYEIIPLNNYKFRLSKVKDLWLSEANINTIIDVGASDGGFALKIRKSFPEAQIYSFEPIESSYNMLKQNFIYDNKFEAFNIGCSNEYGKKIFYLNNDCGNSSLYQPSNQLIGEWKILENYKTIEIIVDKLDKLLLNKYFKPNILLKIDVQGYEKNVLEGAAGLLKNTKIAIIESSFVELYNGQALINEIFNYMTIRYSYQ